MLFVSFNMSSKPTPRFQGTIVVQENGDEYLIMFPDGHIEPALDKADVEAKAKRWFKKTAQDDKFNIGMIEWR